MTDIVKRLREARELELRDYEPTMQLFVDAANEIERLRQEVELWKCRVNEAASIIEGNVAIIEELRAEQEA